MHMEGTCLRVNLLTRSSREICRVLGPRTEFESGTDCPESNGFTCSIERVYLFRLGLLPVENSLLDIRCHSSSSGVTGRSIKSNASQRSFDMEYITTGASATNAISTHCRTSQSTFPRLATRYAAKMTAKSSSEKMKLKRTEPLK